MIQQQIIRDIKGRLKYIQKQGIWKKDQSEVMGRIDSKKWDSQIFQTLDEKPSFPFDKAKFRQKGLDRQYRAAREIIVPIPHCLENDIKKQSDFIMMYMYEFHKKFNLDDQFIWTSVIHNKTVQKGLMKVKNLHAHVLFSERLLLNTPIMKHYQKRYYNQNLRQCNKSEALKLENGKLLFVPAYDKKLYFDENKIKNSQGKYLFASQSFCYDCDTIWKKVVLDLKLFTKKELEEIFIPYGFSKTKHLGNTKKINHLSEARESARQRQDWNISVKNEYQESREQKKEKSRGLELSI